MHFVNISGRAASDPMSMPRRKMIPKVLDRLSTNLEATNQKMKIVPRTTLTQNRMGCLAQAESIFFKLAPFYQ